MNRLAIVELARHSEVVRAYLSALIERSIQFYIFTNEEVFDDLYQFHSSEKITWHIRKKDESLDQFFKSHHSSICSADALLCTTLEDQFGEFINVSWPTKSFLVLHDLHSTFDPWSHIDFSGNLPQKLITTIKLTRSILLSKNKKEPRQQLAFCPTSSGQNL